MEEIPIFGGQVNQYFFPTFHKIICGNLRAAAT
jgi:hypothetical protein